jgi:type I restriction enzyme R subunit
VRQARPDGWRRVQAKENLIKAALFNELQDPDEVERIFAVVFAQSEY